MTRVMDLNTMSTMSPFLMQATRREWGTTLKNRRGI